MFDVAIYTDTRADESIDGSDGFDFQAVSEGITAQDRQVIEQYLLHRRVDDWDADHDPLSHPPTFVFAPQGSRFYLSRGISTGDTNNGRIGNMLTEAIVTADALDLGAMRPAQLFGAVRWSLTKAPGRQLEQWAPPLEIVPAFEVDALCDMIKMDSWATGQLAAILTMVEELLGEASKRLVLITRDEILAQRWSALLTLFVDADRAATVSIRGLVRDPMTAMGDIVAASPDFGPQLDTVTVRAGANVIDLDARSVGPVTPSDSARLQADWFARNDALTALGAIELARRWETILGPSRATRAAAAASFPAIYIGHDSWLEAMEALTDLAAAGQNDDILYHGDALIDVAVMFQPVSADDGTTAARAFLALAAIDAPDATIGVLIPALEAAAASPPFADAWLRAVAEARVPALNWPDAEAPAQAMTYLVSIARAADERTLPDLMTALARLGLPVSADPLAEPISRLAHAWATDPAVGARNGDWIHRAAVIAETVPLLLGRWDEGHGAALQALLAGEWSWLAASPDTPTDCRPALAAWLTAAGTAGLPVPERRLALRSAGPLPPESWTVMWRGTDLRSDSLYLAEWIEHTGVVTDRAGRWLCEHYDRLLRSDHPSPSARDLLIAVANPAIQVYSPLLWQLAQSVGEISADCRYVTRTASRVPPDVLARVVPALVAYAPLFADFIGELCLGARDRAAIDPLLRARGAIVHAGVLSYMRHDFESSHDATRPVRAALGMIRLQRQHPVVIDAAAEFLQQICESRDDLIVVEDAISSGEIGPADAAEFDAFAKEAHKGRAWRRVAKILGFGQSDGGVDA